MDDTQPTTEYTINTTEQEPPKCPNKPLFMPVGSIRAMLAMGVVAAFTLVCLQTENIEALAVIATMVAKDYFTSRE